MKKIVLTLTTAITMALMTLGTRTQGANAAPPLRRPVFRAAVYPRRQRTTGGIAGTRIAGGIGHPKRNGWSGPACLGLPLNPTMQ